MAVTENRQAVKRPRGSSDGPANVDRLAMIHSRGLGDAISRCQSGQREGGKDRPVGSPQRAPSRGIRVPRQGDQRSARHNREAPTVIGCIVLLTTMGVILKLFLDDIGRRDTCPYCSASLTLKVAICPPVPQGYR